MLCLYMLIPVVEETCEGQRLDKGGGIETNARKCENVMVEAAGSESRTYDKIDRRRHKRRHVDRDYRSTDSI